MSDPWEGIAEYSDAPTSTATLAPPDQTNPLGFGQLPQAWPPAQQRDDDPWSGIAEFADQAAPPQVQKAAPAPQQLQQPQARRPDGSFDADAFEQLPMEGQRDYLLDDYTKRLKTGDVTQEQYDSGV